MQQPEHTGGKRKTRKNKTKPQGRGTDALLLQRLDHKTLTLHEKGINKSVVLL